MNILDRIVQHKKGEVADRRRKVSVKELEASAAFSANTYSLTSRLSDPQSTGIIAEFKRRSPSKGTIHPSANVQQITASYAFNGAAGLSVLTDQHFFGAEPDDLSMARINSIPVLRKDFIIDEYQVVETKAMGADVMLLIAACLSVNEVRKLSRLAKSLGLEVLLEIHDETELHHIGDDCDLVGVNNRDLKSFTVDINRSIELSAKIPRDKIKISESGISDTNTIHTLRAAGFSGFLIGENFMKQQDPAIAFASFVNQLKLLSTNPEST